MAVDILIVDDDRVNRRLLKRFLEAEGYTTRLAQDGEEALRQYEQRLPDVVLLDVMMPGIDGYEVARRMKAELRERYVPILMLSALNGPEDITEGLQAGADDFLSKPYVREILYSRIHAALRTQRLFNSLSLQKTLLQEMREREQQDLLVAERVMAGINHSDLLQAPFIKSHTTPADIFNGDLLMAESTPSGRIRVMLADFSGHGLAAAIGSQPVAFIFRAMTKRGEAVHRFFQAANQQLKALLPPELFLALCVVELDPAAAVLSAWNAGMPPVFVYGADGRIKERIRSSHVPLGIVDAMAFEQPSPILLEDDDRVFLHSDGLTEAMNPDDEEFGEARLLSVLEGAASDDRAFETLTERHLEFREGRPMSDDLTYVEIRHCRDVRIPTATTPEKQPPDLCLSLRLGARTMATLEPTRLLQSVCSELPVLKANPSAMTVLVELFNNAVDHGVLGLDSAVKQGSDGFERYYEMRASALERLRSGSVKCDVELRDDARTQLVLRVEDSGPGFDVKNRRRWGQEGPRTHGMGISLAQQLSCDLVYSDNGNRVEARIELEADDVEDKAS